MKNNKNTHFMQEMYNTLRTSALENPKEFWGGLVTIIGAFALLWASLWIEAIISGRI